MPDAPLSNDSIRRLGLLFSTLAFELKFAKESNPLSELEESLKSGNEDGGLLDRDKET
jgi:hypothetical protein